MKSIGFCRFRFLNGAKLHLTSLLNPKPHWAYGTSLAFWSKIEIIIRFLFTCRYDGYFRTSTVDGNE